MSSTKYFLDTSAARQYFEAPAAYRQSLRDALSDDQLYVSNYVWMEYARGFLATAIEFYFHLHIPHLNSISDALSYWKNKFGSRDQKVVIELVSQLIQTHELDREAEEDKEKAARILARIIRRYERRFRSRFKNVGQDSTRCSKATVGFNVELENAHRSLRQFYDEFIDKEHHKRCRMKHFFVERHANEVQTYIEDADSLPKNNKTRGFRKIAKDLDAIRNGAKCSCHQCSKVGDAIIALDCPDGFQVETLDRAFHYLCPPIGQSYRIHPSVIQFFNDMEEDPD